DAIVDATAEIDDAAGRGDEAQRGSVPGRGEGPQADVAGEYGDAADVGTSDAADVVGVAVQGLEHDGNVDGDPGGPDQDHGGVGNARADVGDDEGSGAAQAPRMIKVERASIQ